MFRNPILIKTIQINLFLLMNGGGGFEPRENGLCHDSWQCLEIPFEFRLIKQSQEKNFCLGKESSTPSNVLLSLSLSLTRNEKNGKESLSSHKAISIKTSA